MFIIEHIGKNSKSREISTDIRTAVDIIIGLVNNEKVETEAYNFMCNANFGDYYVNKEHNLAIRCVKSDLHSGTIKHSIRNKDIVDRLKNVINNPLSKTNNFTLQFYKDECWGVTLERLPQSGIIRFWVEVEYSSGDYKSSLCNVHIYEGKLRYSMEFKPKERVIKKILSLYKDLYNAGLIVE